MKTNRVTRVAIFRRERVIAEVGANTWLMHLDDAASCKLDDDDNDALMQLQAIHPAVPEPSSIAC
jgi:hypothetical protein